MSNVKLEQLKEYAKILVNTPYALKTYLQTYDNTQKKFVPFDLFPDQISLVNDLENFNENITKKYRQAGVTTVVSAWVSKKLQLASEDTPEKVLIIANKRDTAIEMANKIRGFIDQWPEWINVGYSPDKNSESRFKLKNKSEVKAVATSKDALRGYTPTILIFDEAAYIEAGEDFWAASMASLSTGGKIIVISTPNGYDQIYYPIYNQALRKENNFHITELKWYRDPRYAKDLKFIKVNDIVHYMLSREEYNDDEITIIEDNPDNYEKLIKEGYKPYSSWFESMAKKLKFDKRKISQEIDGDFLGSGDRVISNETTRKLYDLCLPPTEKYMMGQMWQWKEPIEGHKYILGCDVSRGDSEDYSAINIIDFTEKEQVLEYIGKTPPDVLATIVYKWGIIYNAFVITDITGGMGVATSRKLIELGYKNLYYDGLNNQVIWEHDPKIKDKIPGISFNNKRSQIISVFEEQLRNDFIVRSERLMNEINTFVFINGRPDHMKGTHDDSIMSLAIALYAGEMAFTQLKKAEQHNIAMLDSYTLSERKYNIEESIRSDSTIFNPNNASYYQNNPIDLPKEQYTQYSWLFGKPK